MTYNGKTGNRQFLLFRLGCFDFYPPNFEKVVEYIGFGLSVSPLLQTGFEWLCFCAKHLYVAKWVCVASQIAPIFKLCQYRVLKGGGANNQILIIHLDIAHPYERLGHGGPGLCDLYLNNVGQAKLV